jgi:hypothetical protein
MLRREIEEVLALCKKDSQGPPLKNRPYTVPSLWIDDDFDRLGRDTVNDNNEVASAQLLVCRHIERRGYEII